MIMELYTQFGELTLFSVPLYELIGYTGVALLIITYGLLQTQQIDPKGFWYSFNNLLVAILVTVSLLYTLNKPSMVIEFFWFIISLYGIVMYFKRKKPVIQNTNTNPFDGTEYEYGRKR